MQKFSSEKIEKLIDLVKMKPALYDKRERSYKKIDKRDRTWLEIAANLDADVKDCKTAWRSLRDQFQKCVKEMKGSTGQATVEQNKKYKYFQELLFLKESIEPRKTNSNYVVDEEQLKFETNDSEDSFQLLNNVVFLDQRQNQTEEDSSAVNIPPSSNDSSFPPEPMSRSSSSLDSATAASSNKRKRSPDRFEYWEFLKELLLRCKKADTDGVDNFFLGISCTVKKHKLSPTELARVQCKAMICVTEELEKIQNKNN